MGTGKVGRPAGAYTQYRRLSQLREMLESHPKGLSLPEIAVRLRVTDRSVRRYLRELEREVDVERSSHPDGPFGVVVKIPSRDLPRRVKLHRTQIYGLLMARRVFQMLDGTVFESALHEAVDQLLAHVQRPPRRGAVLDPDTRLHERFLYLPSTPMRPLTETPDVAEVVDTVIDACAQLRVCEVRYKKAPRGGAKDAAEALTIHPYAVVLYKDAIYCVAFVEERGAVRTLRVDRMVDAEASTAKHFTLPDDFSVDAHFQGQFGVHGGETPKRVVIEFQESVAEYVRSRRFPGEGGGAATVEELPSGRVRLVMHVGATTEVLSWVLSFGDKARVIEPVNLAEGVVAELRGALEAYEATTLPAEKQGEARKPVRKRK